MPINYIPNDPLAQASLPIRQQNPRPNRPATRAGFTFTGATAVGTHPPGTAPFLFWQCREAALAAVEIWERIDRNLTQWSPLAPNRRRLALRQNAGIDLNAYYDGTSLAFFQHTTGTKTTFSGASTDVVAHEAGHAFLDAIRHDLWTSSLPETNAFHEAFGDCVAILTALFDQPTRVALLAASANLGAANFVEATAEDLSDGVARALGASHPAAAPRHAFNAFRWALPNTLPPSGPPPVLTGEVHSFGRIFSGCFYDVIRNVFNAFPVRNEAALLTAATTAGKLLAAAARQAPETSRFFQSVGRAMVLADQTANSGANHTAIRNAFTRHNIALGSNAMLAPRAGLAGAEPQLAPRAAAILTPATQSDLKRRIGAKPGARLTVEAVEIGGQKIAKAVHLREVSLGSLSKDLKGVIARAPEPMLVGGVGRRAALLGALPEQYTTEDEVLAFVESLLKNDDIAFGKKRAGAAPARRRTTAVGAVGEPAAKLPTHTIVTRGGRKLLERVRFACDPRGCVCCRP